MRTRRRQRPFKFHKLTLSQRLQVHFLCQRLNDSTSTRGFSHSILDHHPQFWPTGFWKIRRTLRSYPCTPVCLVKLGGLSQLSIVYFSVKGHLTSALVQRHRNSATAGPPRLVSTSETPEKMTFFLAFLRGIAGCQCHLDCGF